LGDGVYGQQFCAPQRHQNFAELVLWLIHNNHF
jgi:hypothetical protein